MSELERKQLGRCLLIEVLRDLRLTIEFDLRQWDILLRQARRADLLGRIAYLLAEQDLLDEVPEQPRAHLLAAHAHALKHDSVIRWEIAHIQKALGGLDIPVVYLKGAAYVLRNLPPMRGRVYSDVDIMVPKTGLAEIEKVLAIHGWMEIKQDNYDQLYYRKWMHEIPPLRHRHRQTVIDVHHRILPETTMAQPDPALMFNAADKVSDMENAYTLCDIDMVIHSATHLFYEGEFEHGIRDLVDLDDLYRLFSVNSGFWEKLIQRASELELSIPLYYSLRFCERILSTPVPAMVWQKQNIWRPALVRRKIMDNLFLRALMPVHMSCDKSGSELARKLLYIRSHYLRMPFFLLIPHLARKAFRKEHDL